MKFLRRISTGSMSSSSAAMSSVRSTRWIASGRPAPRYAATGVVLVTAACQLNSTFGTMYTFCAIICVKNGRNAPTAGYAPASATVRTRSPVIVPSRFRPIST